MRPLVFVLLLGLPALAQTHVFHTPIPMDRVQGVFAMQGAGALDFGLDPAARAGGFLDLWAYRGRFAMSAVSVSSPIPAAGLCYTAALDYLGWTLVNETTYRIRYGAGGGAQLCRLRDVHGTELRQFRPLVEGVASLQYRVFPNVVGDVSLSAGWPEGLGAAVAFGFAF
ncbi:hypothetical protein Ocepr_2026 [Oceanithermus profundus DSM 14977]|uniref:Uncharacterized protein n=1 Tax=Oceanithermus profundus (strain DSM 14977 / NBRC 100410 / VKM B-2274 / 506) TaxID=670487 RepID=E4U565_OCEP5|nr:hypothetical protein [Oceanithermus profundus]ADR37477.1 hypothetical protein Ocepr_2026 [Oceanithermus profundus DSM 14977]